MRSSDDATGVALLLVFQKGRSCLSRLRERGQGLSDSTPPPAACDTPTRAPAALLPPARIPRASAAVRRPHRTCDRARPLPSAEPTPLQIRAVRCATAPGLGAPADRWDWPGCGRAARALPVPRQ